MRKGLWNIPGETEHENWRILHLDSISAFRIIELPPGVLFFDSIREMAIAYEMWRILLRSSQTADYPSTFLIDDSGLICHSSHCLMCAGLSFTDDHKLVICGVLYRWERGEYPPRSHKSKVVADALWRIFKENWSIIIYDKFREERGSGTRYHYDKKTWVYGVSTTSTSYDEAAIIDLLKRRFGWANVSSIDGFQKAAQEEMNRGFQGRWRVHVVNDSSHDTRYCSVYGADWVHDGYWCIVMRES
jgi:hypothetical protein